MKTLLLTMMVAALAAGCVSHPDTLQKEIPVAPPVTRPARPPITANQINLENAHAISAALADEMDQETASDAGTPPSPAPAVRKK